MLFVFFESPHRLNNTLKEILEIIGDREIFIAREMTKIHQELFRGRVTDALKYFSEKKVMGEITVVLSGRDNENEKI
jgi:16S rRNA (cytidine1402-2'-O)-methyltransferase